MSDFKSGWYYDNQLENRLTSMTLHPNRQLNEKGEWVAIDEIDREDGKEDSYNKNIENCYSKTPIAQSIIQEDFSVNITNNWSEMDMGGDIVAGLWNSARQFAPFVEKIDKVIDEKIKPELEKRANKARVKDEESKTWSEKISEAFNKVLDKKNEVFKDWHPADMLNRTLLTQGTRFSYYNGSSVTFNNMAMQYTIFPKIEDGRIITVNEQVEKLYTYVLGAIEDFGKKSDKDDEESIKSYLKWQKAPGGYKPDLKEIDIIQPGTFKLKIGAMYSITNLVCDNAAFTFSRQLVKFPSSKNNTDVTISPLFCNVSLSLRPVSKYSDRLLRAFVKKSNEEVSGELRNKLDEEIKLIQSKYNVS